MNRVMARLCLGDYAIGFAEHDALLDVARDRTVHPGRRWAGETIEGGLLIDPENWGFGDSIMAARWVPVARARVGHVVLLLQPELVSLMTGQFEGVSVVAVAPPAGSVECWTRGDTLPTLLGVRSPTDVSPDAYLRVDHSFRPLGGRFKVGVVWAGEARHTIDLQRSTALIEWDPVLQVPDTSFYSLQVGPPALQLKEVPWPLVDLAEELTDWRQTAAAMMELDLIISVDTAVAHLAGALGRPVWICLPAFGEYRWMLEGKTTHWYGSARLYRQSKSWDWSAVFTEVARDLAGLVEERRTSIAS